MCAYTEEGKTDAFSLTLCAGLSLYNSAEENIEQHWLILRRFETPQIHPDWPWETVKGKWERSTRTISLPTGCVLKGFGEKYYLDMQLVYDGCSFVFTRKGRFGLGPLIAQEGVLGFCCLGRGPRIC